MDHALIGGTSGTDRYAVLHSVAMNALTDLQGRYLVRHESGANLDPELVGKATAVRVDRLSPEDLSAAPVTVAFTDFPGLLVRFGRWHTEGFPRCGCDYCNEAPDELASSLVDKLNAVALGWFSESETSYEFRLANGSREAGQSSTRSRDSSGNRLSTQQRPAWSPCALRTLAP